MKKGGLGPTDVEGLEAMPFGVSEAKPKRG
jgi:hypothetical protein